MIDLKDEFLQEYNELDNLIKQYLKSEKGINTYIDVLDALPEEKQFLYYDDIKKLKHMVWLNQKLDNSEECEVLKDDVDELINYYTRIINNDDPLRLISKEDIDITGTLDLFIPKEKEVIVKEVKKKRSINLLRLILIILIILLIVFIVVMFINL